MEKDVRETVIDGRPAVMAIIPDFDPVHTFESGQCFRWFRQPDGSYTGMVGGEVLNVSQHEGEILFKGTDANRFRRFWHDYFDLGRDYGKVKNDLGSDAVLKKAVNFGWGIRILRQDIWEILISFIISANNRIPMIMKVIENICRMYGERIEGEGEHYAFPAPDRLAESQKEKLEMCRAGFRCKYIKKAAQMVCDGEVDIYGLRNLSAQQAREELKKIPGVGDKVADCVLLYSGTKYDIFPTDVWIKRIMETLYFKRPASIKEIHRFAYDRFGDLAGFAQQYLFYYARLNKVGV